MTRKAAKIIQGRIDRHAILGRAWACLDLARANRLNGCGAAQVLPWLDATAEYRQAAIQARRC